MGELHHKNLLVASKLLFFCAAVFVLAGFLSYVRPASTGNAVVVDQDAPTLHERQEAIDQARQKGDSTYSFTTNFTPGLGYVSSSGLEQSATGQ